MGDNERMSINTANINTTLSDRVYLEDIIEIHECSFNNFQSSSLNIPMVVSIALAIVIIIPTNLKGLCKNGR
jgi:hypothetical protein